MTLHKESWGDKNKNLVEKVVTMIDIVAKKSWPSLQEFSYYNVSSRFLVNYDLVMDTSGEQGSAGGTYAHG